MGRSGPPRAVEFFVQIIHRAPTGRMHAELPINDYDLCLKSEIAIGRPCGPDVVSALTLDDLRVEGGANPPGYERTVTNLPGMR
jgi:hypothetical protein